MPTQGQANPSNPSLTWDAASNQWVPQGGMGATGSAQLGAPFGSMQGSTLTQDTPSTQPNFGAPSTTASSIYPPTNVPNMSAFPNSGMFANFSPYLPFLGGLAGGIFGGNSINNATNNLVTGGNQAINTIQQGGQRAQGTLGDIWKQIQGMYQPYTQAGQGALQQAAGNTQFSFNPSDLPNDPGYQWRLQQGEAAVNASEAAAGNRFSPVALKDVNNYAQGAASQEYGAAYQRAQDTFNQNFQRSAQIAGMGLNATGNEAQSANVYGTNLANIQVGDARSIAEIQTQIANARASGNIAQANNLQGTLNNIVKGVQQSGILKTLGGGSTNVGDPGTGVGPASAGGGPGANPGLSGPDASGLGGEPTGDTFGGGDTVQNLPGSIGTVAGLGSAGIGAALGGGGAAGLTPVTSVVIPGVTDALGAGAGAGSAALGAGEAGAAAGEAGAAAGEAGAAGGGLGGALSSIGSLMSNPITIGVGAALAGALIWKNSQVHPVADKFVQTYQNPFGQHLSAVVDGFGKAFASGQMTRAQGEAAYQGTQQLIQQFMADGQKFAQGGDKQMKVWKQATRTMAQDFGGDVVPGGNGLYAPDFSKILVGMRQQVDSLQG